MKAGIFQKSCPPSLAVRQLHVARLERPGVGSNGDVHLLPTDKQIVSDVRNPVGNRKVQGDGVAAEEEIRRNGEIKIYKNIVKFRQQIQCLNCCI